MEEVKASRDEVKLLSDKVASLAECRPHRKDSVGATNNLPSSTIQSSEHISRAHKKPVAATSSAANSADMLI